NRAHLALAARAGRGLDAVETLHEGPDVFAHGDRRAFAPGGLHIDTFHAFLAAGPHTREALGPVAALQSPFELLVELPVDAPEDPRTPVLDLFRGPDPLLPGFAPTALVLARYTDTAGRTLHVFEHADGADGPLPLDPAAWELRFASEQRVVTGGAARRVYDIGRPLHDGPRRLALIEALRRQSPERTLVLAAGEDIETFSFTAAGRPDLQRPNTWDAFRRMGLDALVPGGAEAAFGLDRLQREAQENEVAVIAANVADVPFAGWRLFETGPVTVLVVGLVDPDMRPADRLRAFGDRNFADTGAAVARAVSAARDRLGRRPDLVVGVGLLGPEARAALVRDTDELDLLLADFDDRGVHHELVTTALPTPEQRAARARDRQPLPLAHPGVTRLGLAQVELARDPGGRFEIVAVHSEAVPVYGTLPADEEAARAVQRVRQAVYAPAQTRLLPDLGPGIAADPALLERFYQSARMRRLGRSGRELAPLVTADLWRTMTANAIRDRLDAEVVLLPVIPFPWTLSGPISRLEAVADLNIPDRIRVTTMTAAELLALYSSSAFPTLVTAGLAPPAEAGARPRVLGRPIDDRETYRVAYADGLPADPRLAAVLGRAARERFVRLGDGRYATSDSGAPLPVRDLAVDALGARADEPAALLAWMHPSGAAKVARWVLDLQSLAFEGSVYQVVGAGGDNAANDGYGEVRETRVTTADNRLIAARGDVYLNREGTAFDWVNRLHVEFAKGYYDVAADQETADEARLSTELQITPLVVPGIGGVPYVNLAYATEFTPTDDNPRKKQLEGTLGLVWKGEWLISARAAGLVAHDFSSPVPDPQVGALAAFDLRVPLPASVWFTTAELRYYIPGIGEDAPNELGVIAKARTGLDVPLLGRLALGVYVDVYGYRGQVDAAHDPGASIISGLSLKYDGRFKPGF
ncbi:MAG: hypothetical protein H6703_17505, partial [Myxococcales bacterium]|nr:hypothetical protein [Myxococcales bacterium]